MRSVRCLLMLVAVGNLCDAKPVKLTGPITFDSPLIAGHANQTGPITFDSSPIAGTVNHTGPITFDSPPIARHANRTGPITFDSPPIADDAIVDGANGRFTPRKSKMMTYHNVGS